jgi:outer membrane biosynthesis protein TonB
MNLRKTLQVLAALAGLITTQFGFAEIYRVVPNAIAPWLVQESNPSIQTQGTESRANDVEKSGPDVSPPVLIHSVEPKFSKGIRRSRIHGNVLVNLYIEANGSPSNVHVAHVNLFDGSGKVIPSAESTPEGQDLAKTAVDAVSKYRFKPAIKSGKPVKVELNVEVSFQSM